MDLSAWVGVGIMVAALAYIPISTWAASGSLSRGMRALREYLGIMGALVLVALVIGVSLFFTGH